MWDKLKIGWNALNKVRAPYTILRASPLRRGFTAAGEAGGEPCSGVCIIREFIAVQPLVWSEPGLPWHPRNTLKQGPCKLAASLKRPYRLLIVIEMVFRGA